jgi:hypothetical protein
MPPGSQPLTEWRLVVTAAVAGGADMRMRLEMGKEDGNESSMVILAIFIMINALISL